MWFTNCNFMTARFDYASLSGTLLRKFFEFSTAQKDSSIETGLRDLINIRISQINGCAFCLDMHVKEAKLRGEGELRLHHLAIWHESPLFTVRERAALTWAEHLTLVAGHGISENMLAEARDVLSDKEISDLSFAVIAINGWNRISIASAAVPGSQDAAYGLNKVSFS